MGGSLMKIKTNILKYKDPNTGKYTSIPVVASGEDVSDKQDKNDNALNTTSKTIVGAINELSNDISNLSTSNVAYATCETAAATAEKVVTTAGDDDWSLSVGSVVMVYFTTSNSASNVKLNVNGTGAYPIWYNNAEYTSTGTQYCGYAKRVINYMFNGTHWVWIGSSYDSNTTYKNTSLGHGYATCSTAEATTAKVGTLSSYTLTLGGIVAVKFTYAVPANATLNINSKGAKNMFYRGAKITAGVIKADDIATFIYDGTQYQLLSIDRWQNDIDSINNEIVDLKVFVTPQMFGAYGDGSHDDTQALQNAFNHVATNGGYLFIPKGRYKVTSPITVDWSSTSSTRRNFLQKIIGAGSQAFERYYDNTVIIGYNIPAYRGVIELVGNGNTWGTETRIEDLAIECDSASCDPMSFALRYGDARNFKLSRVKLRGHNGIYARCGSIVDSSGNSITKGYEQMNVKFEQCDIYAFEENTKGFAFLPEGVITSDYDTMDNIMLDSCLISGVWVITSVNIMFLNCHVLIRNVENKEITTDNVGLLNGHEIDYATGYYVAQAMSAVFQNCYFEDYRRGIHITPTLGNVRNVSIMNCFMNPGCNQFDSDNNRINADYGIRINAGASGKEVRNVLVQNNVFRYDLQYDTEFVVAYVSNEFANHFVFKDNCTTSTQEVPKVINTTTSGYDIQNGLDSGASVKSMTTFEDGKTLTIELTNGKSCTFNIGASAPVKGVDYFTESEIEEITENASVLAKAGLQQIETPTWVESVADMVDESKNYVLLESGNIWAFMKKTKVVAGGTAPNFTNRMNHPEAYIKDGQRYSLSSKAFKGQSTDCAIVITLPNADEYKIRVRGATWDGCTYPTSCYFGTTNQLFEGSVDAANSSMFSRGTESNGDLYINTKKPTDGKTYSYYVFHVASGVDVNNLIVTVNEEITYTTTEDKTEVVTEWTDTGHSIVPIIQNGDEVSY